MGILKTRQINQNPVNQSKVGLSLQNERGGEGYYCQPNKAFELLYSKAIEWDVNVIRLAYETGVVFILKF